jgi:hypothetical protein
MDAAAFLIKRALMKVAGPEFKTLKKHQVKLEPEERALAMKRKAIWHQGPGGTPSCAIKKSIVKGKTWYWTHTHRALQSKPTLKGAVRIFHDFIKGTA